MRMQWRRPSGSASLSLRRITFSICPALYIVSLARMTLMATSGWVPAVAGVSWGVSWVGWGAEGWGGEGWGGCGVGRVGWMISW